MDDQNSTLVMGGIAVTATAEDSDRLFFSDRKFSYYPKRMTGIRLMSGDVVDGVEFIYDESNGTGIHGGPGGGESLHKLDEDEYVTKLSFKVGQYNNRLRCVYWIQFETNKGKRISGGQAPSDLALESHTYRAKEGYYIRGLQGWYHDYLSDIQKIVTRPIGLLRFSDMPFAQDKRHLTEIRLWSGDVVDGVQFVYDHSFESEHHGASSGTLDVLHLDADEYIVSISGKTGTFYSDGQVLCSVTFTTSKDKVLSGGTAKHCSNLSEFSKTADKGEQIFAFLGSYKNYMSTIGPAMYSPMNTAPAIDPPTFEYGSLVGVFIRERLTPKELEAAVDATMEKAEELVGPDSIVKRELAMQKGEIIRSKATKGIVTTEQYVFRGATITDEQTYIQANMKIISKAQKRSIDRPNLWKRFAPIIEADKQNTSQASFSTALRVLATKTTTNPPSQFVSHALDYITASRFSTAVYAYKLVPNSPLLGLGDNKELEAEVQFQILGGTEITELYKFEDRKWQRHVSKNNWSTVAPPINHEYAFLKEEEEKKEKEEKEKENRDPSGGGL